MSLSEGQPLRLVWHLGKAINPANLGVHELGKSAMQLPAGFDPIGLGIETVEELAVWAYLVIDSGYGKGEYRPTRNDNVVYENYSLVAADGNKRERREVTMTFTLKDDINGLSLKEWNKVEEFTTNEIPTEFLTA